MKGQNEGNEMKQKEQKWNKGNENKTKGIKQRERNEEDENKWREQKWNAEIMKRERKEVNNEDR